MKNVRPRIFKGFVTVISLCLLSSFVLTGCDNGPASSGSTASGEEKVVLKLAIADTGYGSDWIEYATSKFTEKHPNVTFNITASPQIGELISTRASANNDDDMFDIFFGNSTEYITSGKAEPVTDVFQMTLDDTGGKKIDEVIVQGFNDPAAYYNGNNYQIPLSYSINGLFYDQDFFKEKGWNTQPKTYDEFIALCQTIKDSGIDPMVVSGLYNYGAFFYDTKEFELALENNNTSYRENFQNFRLPFYTTEENKEVYQRIYDMGKKGYISKQSVGMTHTQSQMLVLQHKAAMCPSGDWIENEMADAVPEGFKWGYMAVPFTNDTSIPNHISGSLSYSLMMWANKPAASKAYSKEFLASLFSLDVQEKLVEKGANSIRTDYASDPARVEKMGNLQKSIAQYMEDNNTVLELKQHKITLTDPDYVAALTLMAEKSQMVYTGQMDPNELLNEAEKLMEKSVKAYEASQAE